MSASCIIPRIGEHCRRDWTSRDVEVNVTAGKARVEIIGDGHTGIALIGEGFIHWNIVQIDVWLVLAGATRGRIVGITQDSL